MGLSIRGPSLASSGRSSHKASVRGINRFGRGKARLDASTSGFGSPRQCLIVSESMDDTMKSRPYQGSFIQRMPSPSFFASTSFQASWLHRSMTKFSGVSLATKSRNSSNGNVSADSSSILPADIHCAVPYLTILWDRPGTVSYTPLGEAVSKKIFERAIASSQSLTNSFGFSSAACFSKRQCCRMTSTMPSQFFSPSSVKAIST